MQDNRIKGDRMQDKRIKGDTMQDNRIQMEKIQKIMKEAEAVVFDIGNVLADFGWRDFFGKFGYEGETLERLAAATVKSAVWDEVDRGVWSEE